MNEDELLEDYFLEQEALAEIYAEEAESMIWDY